MVGLKPDHPINTYTRYQRYVEKICKNWDYDDGLLTPSKVKTFISKYGNAEGKFATVHLETIGKYMKMLGIKIPKAAEQEKERWSNINEKVAEKKTEVTEVHIDELDKVCQELSKQLKDGTTEIDTIIRDTLARFYIHSVAALDDAIKDNNKTGRDKALGHIKECLAGAIKSRIIEGKVSSSVELSEGVRGLLGKYLTNNRIVKYINK